MHSWFTSLINTNLDVRIITLTHYLKSDVADIIYIHYKQKTALKFLERYGSTDFNTDLTKKRIESRATLWLFARRKARFIHVFTIGDA